MKKENQNLDNPNPANLTEPDLPIAIPLPDKHLIAGWTGQSGSADQVPKTMQGNLAVASNTPMAPTPNDTVPETLRVGMAGDVTIVSADHDAALRRHYPKIEGYELIEMIGRGGMGVVYRAHDKRLDRDVAIKTLPFFNSSPDSQKRFENEARLLGQVTHSNVARIYEVGSTAEGPYLAMELVPGQTLDRLTADNPLKPRRAAELVVQLADALHACHQRGVIHRDVKPANAIVSDQDELKLTDFGLARLIEDTRGQLTKTGEILGTPAYMAPEQASGAVQNFGPATDVHGVGAVMYDLLTGRPPFTAPESIQQLMQVLTADPLAPRTLQPGIPQDLETITLKCLAKKPAHRYATCQQVAEDLKRFLRGEPILAKPTPAFRKAWLWVTRHRTVAAMIALAVASMSGALAGVGMHNVRLKAELDRTNKLVQAGRELSIWLLEDFNQVLERDEGLTFVRSQLAERTQEYLDTMREQVSDNQPLKLTLAESLVRLADLQGRPQAGSLGKPELATKNLLAAAEVLQSGSAVDSAKARAIESKIEMRLAELDLAEFKIESAGKHLRSARESLDAASDLPAEQRNILLLQLIALELSQAVDAGVANESEDRFRELTALEPKLIENVDDAELFASIESTILHAQLEWLETQNRSEEIIDPLQRTLQRISALSQDQPLSLTTRMLTSSLQTMLGTAYYRAEQLDQAATEFDQVRKQCEMLLARDALNHGARFNLANAWHWLGDIALLREDLELAETALVHAKKSFQQYAERLGVKLEANPECVLLFGSLAELHMRRQEFKDARKYAQRQIDGLQQAAKTDLRFRQSIGDALVQVGMIDAMVYVESIIPADKNEDPNVESEVPPATVAAFDRGIHSLQQAIDHFEKMQQETVLTPQGAGQLGRCREFQVFLKEQQEKLLKTYDQPKL